MTKQSSIPALIPVLITRPQPQADRFAAELELALPGRLQPVISPLMRQRQLTPQLPARDFTALALTSETGAQSAGLLLRSGQALPRTAFCVGDRTAAEAERQGFAPVSAGGDAKDLLRLILSRPDSGPILYLHGQDRAADLAAALAGQREVTSVVAYQQEEIALTATALDLLTSDGPVILPLLSPRSARLLARALPQDTMAGLWPVTISRNASDALPPALATRAITADTPNAKAVIAGVILAANRLTGQALP